MTSHTGIDLITFTGSTFTGKRVLASAAATLKRATLELGGNDPGIVLADAEPEKIAPALFNSMFVLSGQGCIGASVWDSDPVQLRSVASQLEAGTVWINQHAFRNPFVPASAYKDSGFGVELGQEGLEEFCNMQVIAERAGDSIGA